MGPRSSLWKPGVPGPGIRCLNSPWSAIVLVVSFHRHEHEQTIGLASWHPVSGVTQGRQFRGGKRVGERAQRRFPLSFAYHGKSVERKGARCFSGIGWCCKVDPVPPFLGNDSFLPLVWLLRWLRVWDGMDSSTQPNRGNSTQPNLASPKQSQVQGTQQNGFLLHAEPLICMCIFKCAVVCINWCRHSWQTSLEKRPSISSG